MLIACSPRVQMLRQSSKRQSLGQMLRSVAGKGTKSCDTDEGGCGRLRFVESWLRRPPPRVFLVQLAWQRANEAPEDIRDTLAALHEVGTETL